MLKTVFNVLGMSCKHCVAAINDSVCALSGVTDVLVSLEDKTVTVHHDEDICSVSMIKEAIEEQGYDIAL